MNEALFKDTIASQNRKLVVQEESIKYRKQLIPCCFKFYKSLSQSQMDELILIMKEINSQIKKKLLIDDDKDLNKNKVNAESEVRTEKAKNDLMFFKAERY